MVKFCEASDIEKLIPNTKKAVKNPSPTIYYISFVCCHLLFSSVFFFRVDKRKRFLELTVNKNKTSRDRSGTRRQRMLTIESSCPKGNSAKTSDLVSLRKKEAKLRPCSKGGPGINGVWYKFKTNCI